MSVANHHPSILPGLLTSIERLLRGFDQIPANRKLLLNGLATLIRQRLNEKHHIALNFICTHNSRRSQIAQIWAQAAACFYGIDGVECFSGGTEATAFNPRAVQALKAAGFEISEVKGGDNPIYSVRFSPKMKTVDAFSKIYNAGGNPIGDFVAVMVCSNADQACPMVEGANKRISLLYDDPKEFDGTSKEVEKYTERVHEIGCEMFYCFSQIGPI